MRSYVDWVSLLSVAK